LPPFDYPEFWFSGVKNNRSGEINPLRNFHQFGFNGSDELSVIEWMIYLQFASEAEKSK